MDQIIASAMSNIGKKYYGVGDGTNPETCSLSQPIRRGKLAPCGNLNV